MVKKIEWTASSIIDRIQIYDYWINRNKSDAYSKKLERLFSASAKLLCEFPQLGTMTSIAEVRVKVLKTFKIFYKNEPDRLIILRIIDSRQHPNKFN